MIYCNFLCWLIDVDDAKNDWGVSIREFDMNADRPGTNRFAQEWSNQESNVYTPLDLFGGNMTIITMDEDLIALNDCMSEMSEEKAYKLLMEFNNSDMSSDDIWKIPTRYLVDCANRCAFGICWNDKIYGWICLEFDTDDDILMEHNIACRQCEIIGGGVYYRAVDFKQSNCNVNQNQIANDDSNIQTIQQLPFEILSQTKKPIGFQHQMNHQLGYVCIPLHTLWCGDWKGLFSLLGHKGAGAKCRCLWCDSNTQDQFQSPTPHNRKWKSNSAAVIQQAAISANTNSNNNLELSFKRFPVIPAGFDRLGIPTLHTNLGPTHRILLGVVNVIQEATNSNETILQYNAKYETMHQIESDISNYKHSLRFLQDVENTSQFDEQFVSNMDDHRQTLQQELEKLNCQFKEAEKEFKKCELELKQDNGCLELLDIYDKLKIKPWQVKQSSIVGLAGKNFLKNHDVILDKLKQCDKECYELVYAMCKRLEFIAGVTWTKNVILFNDTLLNTLEWNIHEFQWLYHKFIKKYGGGQGNKYGIKVHGLYHILEWIRFKGWSPATMDDQRVEAWNAYMARYAPLFHYFGGQTNLEKMIDKIWREFVMQWNPANSNFVWNGEKYI